ncbi:MAG TPA: sigma 54-interacting transcriptional regulator, partial [Nannocystis sp.]
MPMTSTETSRATRVLVVDDEASARTALSALLREEGYEVQTAADGYKALGRADLWQPDVVVTDVKMPGLGGLELIGKLREQYPDVAVVVMTAFGSVEGAVEALHLGADDYLSKPIDLAQLLVVLRRVLRHRALQREARELRSALASQRAELRAGVIGQDRAFRDLLNLARRVADSPVSVLISGERGSGKQHLAHLIHDWSGRRGPFVVMRCGGFTEDVCLRELLGVREDGAIVREGRLREADGGTLLLADVDELPAGVQTALLGFLLEREFVRVGGGEPVRSDVRIIASTSHDLSADVARGRFREDLY